MNPLIVLFFVSLIIDDLLFRNGYFVKYYFWSIIAYTIFIFFSPSSELCDPERKFLIASYSHSYDPSAYVKINPEITKAKEYLDKLSEKIGKKITWTLFVTKVVAMVVNKYPDINHTIKYGKLCDRGTVDFGLLVNIREGKVNLFYI
jgi:hypothetical protein